MLETVEAEEVWREKAVSSGMAAEKKRSGKFRCLIEVSLESAITAVSFKSTERRQGEKVLIENSHQQLTKKKKRKKVPFTMF